MYRPSCSRVLVEHGQSVIHSAMVRVALRPVARCRLSCSVALSTVLLAGVGVAPYPAGAASYRLYREVSQAWASRGFVARPSSPTYRAPGPSNDPWGPYIRDAAQRFSLPETWIRAVMHQESGGKQYLNGELTTSGAGAMGLMQLMPATYADMQSQYNLGSDPYDPHDNIQAGAAYIRLMYDRYGAPGFLAAYNAGPNRVDDYLNSGRSLPDETVNYVAAITPHLGGGVAVRGNWAPVPLSQTGAAVTEPDLYYTRTDLTRTADGCLRDPNAAYDPSAPCLMDRDTPHPDPEPQPQVTTLLADAAPPAESTEGPAITVAPVYKTAATIAPAPDVRVERVSLQPVLQPSRVPNGGLVAKAAPTLPQGAHVLSLHPVVPHIVSLPKTVQFAQADGRKLVQVGAFSTYAEAKRVAEKSTRVLASRAVQAAPSISSVSVAGKPLYRAQLVALGSTKAAGVCQVLRASAVPCIQVRNG
ncbi:transglycosylase SLT domain-containing protein [Acetobacter orientalis]|uniref:transglycosylase SLT domain-containing protein n=5 Tax=Acetobacter orientalis TaxID=146474 RepID=UPI0039EC8B00